MLPSCYAATGAGPHAHATDATATDHVLHVATDIAFHEVTIRVWGFPPDGVNRAPAFDERYGVDLWFGEDRVLVLLGGEPGEGTLADGVPYIVEPGPRNAWTEYALDLGALEKKFAPTAYPGIGSNVRVPLVDVPMRPVRFSLTYASRSALRGRAEFGAIDDGMRGKISPEEAFAALDRHPGQVDAYRGAYELQVRNPTRATEYMKRAMQLESHPTLALRAAQVAFQHRDFDEARSGFTRALETNPIEARMGLGWTEIAQKNFLAARQDFASVRADIEASGKQQPGGLTGDQELKRINVAVGIAITYASMQDCAGARGALESVPAYEIDQVRTIPSSPRASRSTSDPRHAAPGDARRSRPWRQRPMPQTSPVAHVASSRAEDDVDDLFRRAEAAER